MSNDFWSTLNKKKREELLKSTQTKDSSSVSKTSESLKTGDFWSVLNEDKKRELLSSATTEVAPTRTFMQDDDDIAPVKGGNKNSVFKSGGFSDGVDGVGDFFFDLGETVAGTAGDLGMGILKGVGRLAEGVVDLGTYGVAGVADLFGADEFADKTRKVAQYSATDEWTKGATDWFDEYSVLGNQADVVSEGVGQVVGLIGTAGLGATAGLGKVGIAALNKTLLGTSTMGSSMGEAYAMGKSDSEATSFGFVEGAKEVIFESLFNGMGKAVGLGKGITSIDEALAKKMSSVATKFITSEAGQKYVGNTIEYAVKMGAEGLEEVLSGFGTAVAKDAILLNGEDEKAFKEILEDEKLLEQFVVGSIVSGIAQGGDFISSTKNGRDFVSGLSKNEQTVVDKVFEQRLAEESENRTLSNRDKNKLYERVVAEMKRGYVTTDEIESILGGETYKGYKDLTDKKKSLESRKKAIEEEIKSLVKTPESQFTIEQREKLTSLREEAKGIKESLQNLGIKTAKNNLFNEVNKLTAKDTFLRESYNDLIRQNQALQIDENQYNGTKFADAAKKTIENARKAKASNSIRVRDFVEFSAKYSSVSGTVVDFKDANQINKILEDQLNAKITTLQKSTTAEDKAKLAQVQDMLKQVQEGKIHVNGVKTKDGVAINLKSPNYLNVVLGHEVTHFLEGKNAYEPLQKAIFKYAQHKGDLDGRRSVLEALYENIDGTSVDYELTADLVGDYLFTEYDFIKNLSTEDRNVFQKVYDQIKYMFKLATAGSKEARELEKVMHQFEKALRESTETSQSAEHNEATTQFSLRTKPAPKKTQEVYKLMRLKDGEIYPLFIDSTEPLKVGEWYDADSPNLDFLKELPSGVFLVDANNGTYQTFDEYLQESGERKTKYPSKKAIEKATAEGKRWVYIEDTAKAQKRFGGETRKYWNIGINGSGGVSTFSMRPGYHAGSLPTMRQIGKGANKDLRDDSFVWTVGEVPADIDYQAEAEQNPDKDIPTHIPEDGYYLKATNADKAKSQADRVGWYVAGAYKINRIISDSEARQVIDNWNAEHPDTPVEYDYDRESGMDFDADQMKLVPKSDTKYSLSPEEQKLGRETADFIESVSKMLDHSKISKRKLKIGAISEGHKEIVEKLMQEINPDFSVDGYELWIDGTGAEHINARHGENGKADNTMASREDKELIPWATNTPDGGELIRDEYGNLKLSDRYFNADGSKAPQIRLHKEVGEDKLYVAECVPDSKNRRIYITSAYKKSSTNQLLNIDSKESPQPTPEATFDSGATTDSIAPLPENVNTQFSLSVDSKGNELSPAVQKRFANSKVRDENGNLKVMHHGSNEDFTVFDKSKARSGGTYGKGFYFTDSDSHASTYGKLYDVYLNITNPIQNGTNDITKDQLRKFVEAIAEDEDYGIDNYGYDATIDSVTDSVYGKSDFGMILDLNISCIGDMVEAIELFNKVNGTNYDGIVAPTETVAFYPEQIKLIDNKKPTDNPDIRYSLSNESENRTPGGSYHFEGKDFRVRSDDDIAPVGDGVISERKKSKSEKIASGERSDELLYESLDNYPIQTIEQKVAEKIRATEGELTDNRDLRKEAEANYESQIAKLRAEYNSKKNKETKVAYGLLQSISRLERLKASTDAQFAKRISDLEARVEKMKEPKYTRAMRRRAKMAEHAKFAEDLLGNTSTWVDKKLGLQYATNTERRNLRDIVRDENGNIDVARADAINDALNGQYNREEADRQRELAQVRKKYADLKITKAEDEYIQMLGELRHNPETELSPQTVNEYLEKHKDKIDEAKVDKVIELARQDYDNFIIRVNEALRAQGMREIPYRQGYFPHFVNPKQNFIQKLFNWKTQDNEIPTSIAGLTEEFKPVKSWQSFDKKRHGDKTDYSFTKGFDAYSNGVLDWIYHLDTIQKRRAVENHIRSTHSDEGITKRIKEVYANEEYDANEAQAQIEQILSEANNPLNNFVQDFMTHTNILTNKKNSLDRTTEQMTNRKIYSVMQNVQNRTSANMVLANVRSALTNFIPITQSWAQVSPLRSLQATKDTIANSIKDDGLINKSTFLTNRLREADNLYKTNWDKVLDKAGIMFEIVDNFSSQVIWRSKYNQNLSNGMSEAEAIANADQFAENVMAGRSKGNEPTLFNAKNPIVKAFTMFQLEVNNQYGYLFKDVPNDLKAETNHWKLNLAKGYTTAFIGAYVYNALLEKVAGSGAALDPIGIIEELLKDLGLFGDDEEEEPDKVITNLMENVGGELPFVGGTLFGGGRIPISSALPYGDNGLVGGISDFVTDVTEGNWKNVGKEMMNPILNVGLPVGGGQLKKTVQGLKMFSDEHPVSGSYTDSGSLRFPVEDTPLNRIQAGIFGQYASKNAREYFDNDYAPLKEKQIQEYMDVDLPIGDYWKYREGLKGLKTQAEKADYVNSLDIADWQKNLLMNNILDRKEDVDMSNYDDYSDWEEFDYAQKNPDKYAFAKSVGGYSAYKTYSDELYDIKADKDEYGKSISGSRKEKVLNYINNLDADYETKIILWKSEYPSDDTYNMDIINYLNNRADLTYEERVAILTELGFTVSGDTVYWD